MEPQTRTSTRHNSDKIDPPQENRQGKEAGNNGTKAEMEALLETVAFL
jgi:hypothetical protein